MKCILDFAWKSHHQSIAYVNGYLKGESSSILHLNVNSWNGTVPCHNRFKCYFGVFSLSLVCFDIVHTYQIGLHTFENRKSVRSLLNWYIRMPAQNMPMYEFICVFVQLFRLYFSNIAEKICFCLAANCRVSFCFILFTGMAWSFRFSTLSKKQMNPVMVLPRQQHFEIAAWLNVLDLPQYNGMTKQPIPMENCNLESTITYIFSSFHFKLQRAFPSSSVSRS